MSRQLRYQDNLREDIQRRIAKKRFDLDIDSERNDAKERTYMDYERKLAKKRTDLVLERKLAKKRNDRDSESYLDKTIADLDLERTLAKKRNDRDLDLERKRILKLLPVLGKGDFGIVYQLTDDIAFKVGDCVFDEGSIHEYILQSFGPKCSRYFLKRYDSPDLQFIGKKLAKILYPKNPMMQQFTFVELLDKKEWVSFFELYYKQVSSEAMYIDESIVQKQVKKHILNALSCLWKIGYRHKDLHANNIMVHKKSGAIKIIDYGKSRNMGEIDEKVPVFKSLTQLKKWMKEQEPKNLRIESDLRWWNPEIDGTVRSSNLDSY